MQLKGRDAAAFLRKPRPGATGLLISGEDVMRVARARADVAAAIVGPEGEAEMRLTRIPAGDLRKDPAQLSDAMRAIGFFPGPRVVVVEDAGDGLAGVIGTALADWRPGDAQIIVTAGSLPARSALRKLFEAHPTAFAMVLHDEPPGPEEIAVLVQAAGLTRVSAEGRAELTDLARVLDPGDFRQTVEKLGLYMYGSTAEVTAADVVACAPLSHEADLDDLCSAVADGREDRIADLMRRLAAQGTAPVGICVALGRYMRQLHALAADPTGPAAAAARIRLPGGFRRRDAMVRQATALGSETLGRAIGQIVDTDLQLRSADTAPDRALVERLLIRLARLRRMRG